MGPRSDERGNLDQQKQQQIDFESSMGPRSDERGNRRYGLPRLPKKALQWGRAQMSAEMHHCFTEDRIVGHLQWGRAQMSAEIRRIGYVVRGRRCSSMGPRSDERGNALLQICLEAPLQSSMGPRSDERGNSRPERCRDTSRKLFNGAALR